MDGFFSSSLKKVGDKLIHIRKGDEIKYKEFVKALELGIQVDIFMEISSGDGSLPQLAKVHKCIRVIANHTGNSFDDIKIFIKDKAGLVIKRSVMGENYMEWKSFGDCSKDELGLAIEACIELGDTVGLNLR